MLSYHKRHLRPSLLMPGVGSTCVIKSFTWKSTFRVSTSFLSALLCFMNLYCYFFSFSFFCILFLNTWILTESFCVTFDFHDKKFPTTPILLKLTALTSGCFLVRFYRHVVSLNNIFFFFIF